MGIMLLPSLEEKRLIRLDDISQTEAELFMKNFEDRVVASRQLKTPSATINDAYQVYRLVDNLEDYDIDEMLHELADSVVPRQRGLRAVFVDVESNTIVVGTTIVYSANWAMIHVDDAGIAETILDYDDNYLI